MNANSKKSKRGKGSATVSVSVGGKGKGKETVVVNAGPRKATFGGVSRQKSGRVARVVRPSTMLTAQRRERASAGRSGVAQRANRARSRFTKNLNIDELLAYFMDTFGEPENNLPILPPLLFEGRAACANPPFLSPAPDVTVPRINATATDPNYYYFNLGEMIGVVRRDLRNAYILMGLPGVAWHRVANFSGANVVNTTTTAALGEWLPFTQATCAQNPYQLATGPECARNDADGRIAMWIDCNQNRGGAPAQGTGFTIGGLIPLTSYVVEFARERAGQVIVLQSTITTTAGGLFIVALNNNAQGWYSIRFTDGQANGIQGLTITFVVDGFCQPLWHLPAPGVGQNLTSILAATAVSGALMMTNASAVLSKDGLALGYQCPTGDTFESLAFSGTNDVTTTGIANDLFTVVSSKVGRTPEAAPMGARAMLPPPARDQLVAEEITDGDLNNMFLPFEKNDETDETILVFKFGPAPTGAASNDVMYYNGAIGYLWTTDNPLIATSLPWIKPTQYDDLSAMGPKILPPITTNALHIKEIWSKIRGAMKFGGAIMPALELGAAIIPGGQAALPFLGGMQSALTAGNYLADAGEAAFARGRG